MSRDTEKSNLPEASDLNHEAYGDGVAHYKQGNYKRAKQAFKLSLEYWPEDPQAWFALGNCFDELKKPSKAEECFRKALIYAQEEKKSDIYFNLGNSLYDQAKYAEAINFYEKVQPIDILCYLLQPKFIISGIFRWAEKTV
jgi:tetratricopeptide (TPR) repeat protein